MNLIEDCKRLGELAALAEATPDEDEPLVNLSVAASQMVVRAMDGLTTVMSDAEECNRAHQAREQDEAMG